MATIALDYAGRFIGARGADGRFVPNQWLTGAGSDAGQHGMQPHRTGAAAPQNMRADRRAVLREAMLYGTISANGRKAQADAPFRETVPVERTTRHTPLTATNDVRLGRASAGDGKIARDVRRLAVTATRTLYAQPWRNMTRPNRGVDRRCRITYLEAVR